MNLLIIHQIVGGCLIALSAYAYSHKDDSKLIKFAGLAAAGWCLNYAVIGAYSASATAGLISLRAWLSRKFHKNRLVSGAFMATFAAIGLATFHSAKDALPVLAAVCGTTAYFHLTGERMRFAFIAASSLWLIHDVAIGSIAALNDGMAIAIHLATIRRLRLAHAKSDPLGMPLIGARLDTIEECDPKRRER